MKTLLVVMCLMAGHGLAQISAPRTDPEVRTVTIEDGAVTAVYLSPGYATSIRLPEEISSVVVGNPANFKAEHSEAEPKLVFLKPITAKPAASNALITTKSGQEISLHLISWGQGASQSKVDFLLEYRRVKSMLITPDANQSFFVSETRPVSQLPDDAHSNSEPADKLAEVLAQQKAVAAPQWAGNGLQAAVGESLKLGQQTILRFSVLNHTSRTIELLPPQIELSGRNSGNCSNCKENSIRPRIPRVLTNSWFQLSRPETAPSGSFLLYGAFARIEGVDVSAKWFEWSSHVRWRGIKTNFISQIPSL
jgi:hypothetical protein